MGVQKKKKKNNNFNKKIKKKNFSIKIQWNGIKDLILI